MSAPATLPFLSPPGTPILGTPTLPWGVPPSAVGPLVGAPDLYQGAVWVTPQMAQQWLANRDPSRRQRNINAKWVSALMETINRKDWVLIHQGAAFCQDGFMFDANHRVTAIAKGDVPVQLIITCGLDYGKVMLALDQVRKRTLGQNLTIMGHRNANVLAAALGWLQRCLGGPTKVRAHIHISYHELVDLLLIHPQVAQMASAATKSKTFRSVCSSQSQFVGICSAFHTVHPVLAWEFFNGVVTGAELASTDPRYLLRERFMRSQNAREGAADNLSTLQRYTYTVCAWNAFARGVTMSRLQAPKYGVVPTIDGMVYP
jgi:hypothetical protein